MAGWLLMRWQDPAMAALLAVGMYATWEMVVDPATRAPVRASLRKAASAGGLGVLQASLGLWMAAAVSAAYVVAFLLLAVLRPADSRVCTATLDDEGFIRPCRRIQWWHRWVGAHEYHDGNGKWVWRGQQEWWR